MTSTISSKKPVSDFENLVRNGIDFLESAISQLENDPKYSVINFYTAVEIFLKAPLVAEHWSLVVVDRDPDRQKYEAGDFISVSFDDACTRLSSSLKRPLKKDAKEAFDKVRKHRNRMVHFYHNDFSGRQREAIKLEQAQAWFELNRFLMDDWRKVFEPFSREFKEMERRLIANNHYAKAKFEHIRPRIDGLKSTGIIFTKCPHCSTDACQVDEPTESLRVSNCKVCFFSDRTVSVECPECGDADQRVSPDEEFACTSCDHTISASKIFSFLDQSKVRYTKHDIDSDTPANCDECQGHHTVCEFNNGYLCTNCFDFFDSLSQCEWCNEPMTGDAEFSYVNGCEHCDGLAGHRRDD